MTDDLRILPDAPLPDELIQSDALRDEYRRLREDITGRRTTRPMHVREALAGIDGDQLVREVDPRSRRQARYTREQKEAYAQYLRDHMTGAEWTLWQHLQTWPDDGITVEAQAIVLGWVVDFYLPDFRLVVEVDGGVHQNSGQWQRDRHKDAVLKRDGYTVLRFTNADVEINPSRCLSRILDTLAGMEAHDAS